MNQVSPDQTQKKLNKCEFLKRTVQFVLSVSVFYFFVWYSSGFSILPQSFSAYFSTCLFSMLTRTLQRKYMFLICNAILALLAKTSLLTLSPSISAAFDIEFQASNLSESETKELVSEEAVFPVESFHSPENASLIVEEEVEQVEKQEEYYDQQVSEAEEEEEEGTLFTETEGRENEEASIAEEEEEEVEGIKDEEDEEGGTGSGVMVTQDDELVETTQMVTNEELANTDELNRKFEEFIRKMKEEIRIEAQTHPIAV